MTNKSDDRVGHLFTILARAGGNLNDPIFKSSNARSLPGGEGMLKFRVDRRMPCQEAVVPYNWITDKIVFGAIFFNLCGTYKNNCSRGVTI